MPTDGRPLSGEQVMSGANPNAVAELMGLLTSVQKGGGGEGQHLLPTLRDLLRQSSQAPLVSPLCDMTSVAKEMSASKKSALVVQNEKVRSVLHITTETRDSDCLIIIG